MFSGAFTALVTPFRNGEVDVEALEGMVEFQIHNGVHGLVPCGTTGETPAMSEEEDRVVISTVVRVANGRVPVVAGSGSNSTDMAIKYTRTAEEAGADGSLQVAPYYNKPTQEGLYRHFATIAENTDLPIILYNIPGRTSVTISAETTARLAEIPNIVGTKEATLSMNMAMDVKRLCGDEFAILSGDDPVTLPLMALGGHGVISVASNVAPAAVSDMVNALLEGDWERGRELHYELLPLFRAL
ncbi:MAG TPA: 4-hydroxy-tetrahydrodipicolinate synthase, partial [Rubrobacter sp.]